MSSTAGSILDQLNRFGFHVKESFLLETFTEVLPTYKEAYDELLHHDFRKSKFMGPFFDAAISTGDKCVLGPAVLQVSSVVNVSQPAKRQHEDSNPRLLLLKVTDGHTSAYAIEYESVGGLSTKIAPGSKIRLIGETKVCHGKLLLTPSCVTVLGGCVDHLLRAWQTNRQTQISRSKKGAKGSEGQEDGVTPPAFELHIESRPQGQRNVSSGQASASQAQHTADHCNSSAKVCSDERKSGKQGGGDGRGGRGRTRERGVGGSVSKEPPALVERQPDRSDRAGRGRAKQSGRGEGGGKGEGNRGRDRGSGRGGRHGGRESRGSKDGRATTGRDKAASRCEKADFISTDGMFWPDLSQASAVAAYVPYAPVATGTLVPPPPAPSSRPSPVEPPLPARHRDGGGGRVLGGRGEVRGGKGRGSGRQGPPPAGATSSDDSKRSTGNKPPPTTFMPPAPPPGRTNEKGGGDGKSYRKGQHEGGRRCVGGEEGRDRRTGGQGGEARVLQSALSELRIRSEDCSRAAKPHAK